MKTETQKVLPKLCGADIELGNFILGVKRRVSTGFEASRALLGAIDGLPRVELARLEPCQCVVCRQARENGKAVAALDGVRTIGFNPQDWGRKYLPSNGGCAYIDLDHLELCLPEVISAYDHVACWHAMLRIARGALEAVQEKLPRGQRINILVNNSDGMGNSYGSHLNFLITRRAWRNIFNRKIHYMLYLASFQASSIVFTGQGKVGSENGAPPVEFQLSQRADFFETLMGVQTTHHRPIVNSRDEALCGRLDEAQDMARMHVIFFDNTLSHVASLLKVGVMQIVLAMIEADRVNPELILDEPVDAVVRWSHDPTLQARAALTSGSRLTAVEMQLRFLEEAKAFVDEGGCDDVVPHAAQIMELWEDTLLKLKAGDLESLASRLDWVLKLSILQQVINERPELSWDSPQVKHLDHIYSSLELSEGLYWAYESEGVLERVVDEDRINYFVHNPPADTRAWTRAMLLRWAGPEGIDEVNWDRITVKTRSARNRTVYRTLDMYSPLEFDRSMAEPVFDSARSVDELLDGLGAEGERRARWEPTERASAGALVKKGGRQ
jgi:proteasome accessory factor A